MSIKIPRQYPLYDSVYGGEVPYEQLFLETFECLPSKFDDIRKKYSEDIIEHLKNIGYQVFMQNTFIHRRLERTNSTFAMINNNSRTMMMVKKSYDKSKKTTIEIVFLYDGDTHGDIEQYYEEVGISNYVVEIEKSGISLIKMEHGVLDTENYSMPLPEVDLELNYGSEFLKLHETIITRLNKTNDKGIILFHGDPGTGKTSYIRYLTHMIKDKEILFVPPAMAESLSDPSIIPFLMDHQNSVLIIEDAERIIADREMNGSSIGVSNILNLTDGILGDCLNIQVVATFNMKREKIDQALLRKGRLIVEHKFGPLSVVETNKLLKHIGKEHTVDKGMTLADIYNIDEEVFKTENKTKIGFNN